MGKELRRGVKGVARDETKEEASGGMRIQRGSRRPLGCECEAATVARSSSPLRLRPSRLAPPPTTTTPSCARLLLASLVRSRLCRPSARPSRPPSPSSPPCSRPPPPVPPPSRRLRTLLAPPRPPSDACRTRTRTTTPTTTTTGTTTTTTTTRASSPPAPSARGPGSSMAHLEPRSATASLAHRRRVLPPSRTRPSRPPRRSSAGSRA